MKIELSDLTEIKPKACDSQVKLFQSLFPDGAEITIANLQQCQAAKLDVEWFINRRLPLDGYNKHLLSKSLIENQQKETYAITQQLIRSSTQFSDDEYLELWKNIQAFRKGMDSYYQLKICYAQYNILREYLK